MAPLYRRLSSRKGDQIQIAGWTISMRLSRADSPSSATGTRSSCGFWRRWPPGADKVVLRLWLRFQGSWHRLWLSAAPEFMERMPMLRRLPSLIQFRRPNLEFPLCPGEELDLPRDHFDLDHMHGGHRASL